MGHGQKPPGTPAHQRLGVYRVTGAGGGIPHMADTGSTGQATNGIPVKNLGNQTHTSMRFHTLPIGNNHSRTLLPTVLEGIKSHINQIRGIGFFLSTVNTKNSTSLFRFIVVTRINPVSFLHFLKIPSMHVSISFYRSVLLLFTRRRTYLLLPTVDKFLPPVTNKIHPSR